MSKYDKEVRKAKQFWRHALSNMARRHKGHVFDYGKLSDYLNMIGYDCSPCSHAFGGNLVEKYDHLDGAYVIGGNFVQFVVITPEEAKIGSTHIVINVSSIDH